MFSAALFRITPNWEQCKSIIKLQDVGELKLYQLTFTENFCRPQSEKSLQTLMKGKANKDAICVGSFIQSSKTSREKNPHCEVRTVVITFEEMGGGGHRKETTRLW